MDKFIIGCGYLGKRVAALWQAQGQRVFATTRARPDGLRAGGIEPVVCDVLVSDSLKALPAVSTVLYCVGLDRAGGASMRDVFVRGLGNALDPLPAAERFLYATSPSVNGTSTAEAGDEKSATAPE